MEQSLQSRFYPGDLMTRTGDREIRSVSGRLPDNAGELACMNCLCVKDVIQTFILPLIP